MKPTEEKFEDWNERMAVKFNPDTFITGTGWPVRLVEKMRLKAAQRALQSTPEKVVLDLGCGPGNLSALLSGQRIVCVDLSEALLELAKKRLADKSHYEFHKANAESLPFSDSIFDRVICSEVLEHVQSPQKVLSEIWRVSKPAARVVITLPNEELITQTKKMILNFGLKKWISGSYAMSDDMMEEWHVTEFSTNDLIDLTKGRYKLEKSVSVPFGLLPFHRIFVLTVTK